MFPRFQESVGMRISGSSSEVWDTRAVGETICCRRELSDGANLQNHASRKHRAITTELPSNSQSYGPWT